MKRKKLPALSTLRNKLDALFSEYIRRRDEQAGCVTCGKFLPWKEAHAGHFIKRQFMSTRYDERNAHGQCPQCNKWRGGELILYYRRMLQLYGQDVIDHLMERKQRIARMRRADYDELIERYRTKLEALEIHR